MMMMHGGGGGGESKNVFVYTLPLEDKCWYVGTSKQPHARLKQHRTGIGPEWTKLHPPIKGFQGLKHYNDEQEARLQEDVQVKRLMLEHGTDFVRGGSYSGVHLSQVDLQTLNKELFHATNRCMRCGGEGHWAKDCVAAAVVKKQVEKQVEKVEKTKKEKTEKEKKRKKNKNTKVVVKEKPVKGSIISIMIDAGRRKRKRCYDDDNNNNGVKVGGEKAAAAAATTAAVCSRCGRNSHTVAHCYAKTHFNGTPLLLREGKDDGKVEEEKEEKEEKPKRKGGGGGGGVGKSSGVSSSNVIRSKYFKAQGSTLKSGTQQRSFSSLELLRMYRSATY